MVMRSESGFDEDVYRKVLVPNASRNTSYVQLVNNSADLKALCKKYVPFWSDLDDGEIEISLITIALTNKVYMVRVQDPDPASRRLDKVLLRVIGEDKRVLYNIEHQNEVFKLLSEYGFCPKMINQFPGGRIETWIEGFVLHSPNLFNLSVLTSVATLLAKLHKIITKVAPKEWDRTPSLLSKTEEWIPKCHEINRKLNLKIDIHEMDQLFNEYKLFLNNYLVQHNNSGNNNLEVRNCENSEKLREKKINAKVDRASQNKFSTHNCCYHTNGTTHTVNTVNTVNSNNSNNTVDSNNSNDTVDSVGGVDEELCEGVRYGMRVVFCHNDMHIKNFIATYDGLTLIDFDYSSFNYVGADIGYFFVESNFDYDVDEYPFFRIDRSLELSYELKTMFASVYLSESLGCNVLPSRKDIIDPFLESVELFSIGTLIFWAYWGILMYVTELANNHTAYSSPLILTIPLEGANNIRVEGAN
eukprot:XP_766066.1 choline kinase [Theileria parva strain Muguga]